MSDVASRREGFSIVPPIQVDPAPLYDLFGRELEVLARCTSCRAPKTRPKGTGHGPTWVHRPGCLRAPRMGDHHEARDWTEQSIERDYSEARDRGDFRV